MIRKCIWEFLSENGFPLGESQETGATLSRDLPIRLNHMQLATKVFSNGNFGYVRIAKWNFHCFSLHQHFVGRLVLVIIPQTAVINQYINEQGYHQWY